MTRIRIGDTITGDFDILKFEDTPSTTITAADSGDGLIVISIAADGGGGGGSLLITPDSRSSNTILGANDHGKLIRATAGFTQTLTAAATLGAGWFCFLKNDTTDGIAELIVDPNSTEQIDGLTTLTMYSGDLRLLVCTGTAFVTEMLQGGFFLATTTRGFVCPSRVTRVDYDLIGRGGDGGAGAAGSAGTNRPGGSGGGGGCRVIGSIRGNLFTPGTSYSLTISVSSTTFRNVKAYRGGHGVEGVAGTDQSGGGGGGSGEFGMDGSDTAVQGGGHPAPGTSPGASGTPGFPQYGQGFFGADSPLNNNGLNADYGGGAGGSSDGTPGATGWNGGMSSRGPGAGAGGGGVNTGNTHFGGGTGGYSGFVTLGGGNGGGAGGSTGGGAGGNGDDEGSGASAAGSSGEGGGGGGGNSGGAGGVGGNGGIPGGGGGGGGGGTTGGAGGTGARGEGRLYYR